MENENAAKNRLVCSPLLTGALGPMLTSPQVLQGAKILDAARLFDPAGRQALLDLERAGWRALCWDDGTAVAYLIEADESPSPLELVCLYGYARGAAARALGLSDPFLVRAH